LQSHSCSCIVAVHAGHEYLAASARCTSKPSRLAGHNGEGARRAPSAQVMGMSGKVFCLFSEGNCFRRSQGQVTSGGKESWDNKIQRGGGQGCTAPHPEKGGSLENDKKMVEVPFSTRIGSIARGGGVYICRGRQSRGGVVVAPKSTGAGGKREIKNGQGEGKERGETNVNEDSLYSS